MDIELLSKMVKEIVLDNDEVTLPGVGTFVAEVVPSTFSDKGYTINPPYRRLSFRQREASDSRLVDFYAASNGVDRDAATSIMVHFLAELKETLQQKKTIVFPGLGRLRATRENNFFFVPDEDLSIYPDGFGLEPVSLKTHVETEDDFQAAVSSIQLILNQPAPSAEPEPEAAMAPEPASEPVTAAEPLPEPVPGPAPAVGPEPEVAMASEPVHVAEPEPEPEPVPAAGPLPAQEPAPSAEQASSPAPAAKVEPAPERKKHRWLLISLLAVIAVLCLFFAAFLILAQMAPDFLDSLLYTQEELDIIHHFQ